MAKSQEPAPKKSDIFFDKPLPVSEDSEKLVLASIILNEEHWPKVSLSCEDFGIEWHRVIFRRMQELKDEGDHIDRVTLINALIRYGELSKAGGMSYVVSLDDGMPSVPNLESYVRIVKDNSIRRRLIIAGQAAIDAAFRGEDSVNKLLINASRNIAGLEADHGGEDELLSVDRIFENAGGMQEFFTNTIKPGVSTGYPQIDEHILGLQEGCQYVVGGSTSSGKTVLVGNIMVNLAQAGYPVGLWSIEMSREVILMRMACALAGVPIKAVIKKDTSKEQRDLLRDAAMRLSKMPIYIDETPLLTCSDIVRRVNKAVRERGLRMFGIDYLQLIDWQTDKTMKFKDEYTAFTYASKTVRMLARQHNNSSILLSQLRRPNEKGRKSSDQPTLADLKATGAIENDATAVLLVHRPELYKPGDAELKGKAELIVAKSRNGTRGTAHLEFQGRYTRFVDHGKPVGSEGDDD